MVTAILIVVMSMNLLLCACRSGPKSESGGRASKARGASGTGTAGAGSDSGTAAAAAARLTDACEVMPADLSHRLVPGAFPPSREQFPLRCTLRNAKSALEITFDTGPDEPVNGAEFVPGLANGAYMERLDPTSRGDVYLTVILGKDPNGINRNLHVEVAGHDGQDHRDDAIAVTKAVLAYLR